MSSTIPYAAVKITRDLCVMSILKVQTVACIDHYRAFG